MSQNPSLQFFVRTVEGRSEKIKSHVETLITILSENDPERKKSACLEALNDLQQLKEMLSPQDYPGWIIPMEKGLQVYSQRHNQSNTAGNLQRIIIENYDKIKNHKWAFVQPTGIEAVNFDETYQSFYNESRAPELFEMLLKQLREIVDSGHVDSLRAIDSLNKVISTIRKNMKGSYFSTQGTLHFTTTLFKNYLKNVLSSIPGVGELVVAFSETLAELEIEMNDVHSKLKKEVHQNAMACLPNNSDQNELHQLDDHGKNE